jgi:hypothetical protein
VLDRDRHREVREAVQEVGGAVERVDDPQPVALAVGAAFLGQHRVVRVRLADGVHDLGLGAAVHVGDEVVAPLARHLQRVGTVEVAHDEVAGRARGRHGDVFEGLHGGRIIAAAKSVKIPR